MKKNKNIRIAIVASAALLLTGTLSAQQAGDILKFSNYDWSSGTARSAAMGGAFSSLGADFSSLAINPAGLGMYQASEAGITLGFNSLTSETNHYELGKSQTKSTKGHLGFNNAGMVLNLYNGSGVLTSATIGFAYNQLIDHNVTTRVRGASPVSIADLFAEQLQTGTFYPDEIAGGLSNGNGFDRLGGMLASLAGVVGYDETSDQFYIDASEGTTSRFDLEKKTEGSTGQYDFGLGLNFSNRLYLGMGFGFQDIYYRERSAYDENMEGNTYDSDWAVRHLDFIENLDQTGSAWNFKIGAVIRPVSDLRIGLALHTPTFITMNERYGGDVQNDAAKETGYSGYYEAQSQYRMRTPMRFIGGISYTLAGSMILSVDYERVWYNQMKMFWNDWNDELYDVTDNVKALYKPANNLRFGLEYVVTPNWFARMGFASYSSMYQDVALMKNEANFSAFTGQRLNYSAGLGYRIGNAKVDLSYVYSDTKEAPARVFAFGDVYSAAYSTQRMRHNVTASLTLRF
ncbi:MAG: outer membrane protein transport protein [Rikenellaceae bacterium]|jgi:hypothetical protein|nr:outer membrane protein transport protein [Rikenellaceae bacterium]